MNHTASKKDLPSKFARRTDLLLIAGVLALCIGGIIVYRALTKGASAEAQIYLGAELLETVPLNTGEDRVFSVPQRENVVFHLYADGSIAFESSDCPDKVCVRSGRLSRPGETAACLPNQLILKIVSPDGDGEYDIVV